MDRLDAMAIFVAVVRHRSLAAAARALGRSPATVTRAVALLESGREIVFCTEVRGLLRLTESGERHVAVYRTILAELASVEKPVKGEDGVEGTLTITAPELFGRLKVMPVVDDFLAKHPTVRVRILLLNRVVELDRRGCRTSRSDWRPCPTLPSEPSESENSGNRVAPPPPMSKSSVCRRARRISNFIPAWNGGQRSRTVGASSIAQRSRSRAVSVAIQPRIVLNSAGAAVDAGGSWGAVCARR